MQDKYFSFSFCIPPDRLINMVVANNSSSFNGLDKTQRLRQKSTGYLRLLVVACAGLVALPLTNAAVLPYTNVIVNSMYKRTH
jgi:hypothetical protein